MCDHSVGTVSQIVATKDDGVTGKVNCNECNQEFTLGQEPIDMILLNEHGDRWDEMDWTAEEILRREG